MAEHEQLKNPVSTHVAQLLVNATTKDSYKHIVMAHSTFGKDVAPRVAGKLDT